MLPGARRDDHGAQLVHALEQPLGEPPDVLFGLLDPDLPHQRDAGDRGVDCGNRGRAGFEPARGRGRRVIANVHLEDVPVGKPARGGRIELLDKIAAAVEEGEPSRAEQILERPGGEEVAAEGTYVDWK